MKVRRVRFRSSVVVRAVLSAALLAGIQLTAMSVSEASADSSASIIQVVPESGRAVQLYVQSPAMQRVVRVDVLPSASSAPHPTLYLLDGTGALDSQPASSWLLRTDVDAFTAKANVNVVMPVGGGGTWLTNWQKDDATLGHNQWETFLTKELPPLIDQKFQGSGVNGIAGLSAGGHAAADLAIRNPALYRTVGVYSGCLKSSDPAGQAIVRSATTSRGGNADNMWGTITDADWAAHDPSRHLGALKGKKLWMGVGSGVTGPADLHFDPSFTFPTDLTAAVALEQGASDCTHAVQLQMAVAGVPVTTKYYLVGTHSWPYWQTMLHDSWPTLKSGLGI